MSNKEYGFYTEKYESGHKVETLMTGDGKTQFTDVIFKDGCVGLGMSYGRGVGVGTVEHHKEGTLTTDVDVKFQVKFESQESIDSMISALLRVKNQLAASNK